MGVADTGRSLVSGHTVLLASGGWGGVRGGGGGGGGRKPNTVDPMYCLSEK